MIQAIIISVLLLILAVLAILRALELPRVAVADEAEAAYHAALEDCRVKARQYEQCAPEYITAVCYDILASAERLRVARNHYLGRDKL